MSKHIFEQTKQGRRYEIQLGWDKPLQQYYGMILGWAVDPEFRRGGYFDEIIWSTIDALPAGYSLENIAAAITQRGFTIPPGLLDNVRHDKTYNISNQWRFYESESNTGQTPAITAPAPTLS